ncbi:DUF6541 family protein [Microbacterium luteum]|uniref:DUF6541 family protein n=1 Tax=Microbacterium luteum TaxID=2782167 RepID=UPI001886FAA6|nr:DUF6541 family protein [Microbacterium luteum]
MNEAWLAAAPSVLIAIGVVLLPGAAVIAAGWGLRSVTAWLFAPAVSLAVVAVAATAAPLAGLSWSPLPVAIVAATTAAVAFAVRRWVGCTEAPVPWDAPAAPSRRTAAPIAAAVGLVAAAATIATQLAIVFGDPENISQTFDAIVHLNAVRLILDTGDASIFTVGSASDIDFYPNGWHSVVTLVAQLGGGGVALAVNAANIAIGAVVWPASALALAAAVFAARPAALALTAALTTGFGAFPLLLLDFGVLYPNYTAYAVLPAGIAAVWLLLRTRGRDRLRTALLLVTVCAAIGISHPNAFLALYALTVAGIAWILGAAAFTERTRAAVTVAAVTIPALALVGVGLWRFGRTNEEMSGWGAWQSSAQAFGEAALVAPRGYPITVTTALLLILGIVVVVRRPARWALAGIPFAAAALLFIVVSGLPVGTQIRDLLTNPWYNDSYRLAALLPIAAIPVAVLGALVLIDLLNRAARRARWTEPVRMGVVALAAAAAFSVAVGPNVTATMHAAQGAYRLDGSAALLTEDEQILLDRLDETLPADAVLIVNPWTGGSLAYALAGREVLELHVFGTRTDDEEYVDAHLADIDDDPRVCEAVDRLGAEYVLDFGSQNVFDSKNSGTERSGINDLEPSDRLVLVDAEGDDARLFRIEGC